LAILGRTLLCAKRCRALVKVENIEHTTTTLVGQRVLGIALGYEDAAGCSRRTPSFSAMVEPAYVNLSDLPQLAGAIQVST